MQLSTSSILQTSLLTLLFIALQEYLKVNVSKNDNHKLTVYIFFNQYFFSNTLFIL